MQSLSSTPPTTRYTQCRERRLRHSAARAKAVVLPTHTHSTPVPQHNTTTNTHSAAEEKVSPQPALTSSSHWPYDGPKHVAGANHSNLDPHTSSQGTPQANGTPPQFVANHVTQPPGSRQQSCSAVRMPDDLLMADVLQPQQDPNRGNRKWPYIRVRPSQAVGSQAGFANKMLCMHGRVLMECSGEEGAFTAIRVLRCTRSMLQGEEAHMPVWLPSMQRHVACARTPPHTHSSVSPARRKPSQSRMLRSLRKRTPAAAAAVALVARPNAQHMASMQSSGAGKDKSRMQQDADGTGMQRGRQAVFRKRPSKHLVQLVRSGRIPRSLADRQLAHGPQSQPTQQFQLHVRKLLAGPVIPSSTLRVRKDCPPNWIASHILEYFMPSHSHTSRSSSSNTVPPRSASSTSRGRSSADGGISGSRDNRASSSSSRRSKFSENEAATGVSQKGSDSNHSSIINVIRRSSHSQNEPPTSFKQGRDQGSHGGVLCLSSFGPIAAVNSLKGVALARRRLHMQGRDVCIVLDAVGVDIDSAREGSTAMNRFMVMECALGDPTRQLHVRGSTWLRSAPVRGPGAAQMTR